MVKSKVSIVLISLNCVKYIEESITSVLTQEYDPLELIVIDGNSTDGTVEILKRYDNQLIWISEPDSGQGDAIQKGISMATGDIFLIQAADDLLYPASITKVVEEFKKYPEAGGIYGDVITIDGYGRILGKSRYPDYDFEEVVTREFVLPAASLFFKREVFEKAKLSRLREVKICPDFYMWLNMGLHVPMVHSPHIFAKYRIHPGSGGCKPDLIDEIIYAQNQAWEWFFNDPNVPNKYKKRTIRRKVFLYLRFHRIDLLGIFSPYEAVRKYLSLLWQEKDLLFFWPRSFLSFLRLLWKILTTKGGHYANP